MVRTMTVSAAYEEETGNLNLFIMNCDLEADAEASLDLRSFGRLKALGQTVLYHDDYFAGNTFEEEFKVVPQDVELSDPVNGKLKVIIKKHSWNVLRFAEN